VTTTTTSTSTSWGRRRPSRALAPTTPPKRSFFETVEAADQEVSPPGYWGTKPTVATCGPTSATTPTRSVSERSRLEVPIGSQPKAEYGFGRAERLRVAVRGEPHWHGDQGRLHLTYDDIDETYRAHQPVTVSDEAQATPTGTDVAALDIGANVLVACTTAAGDQYCYSGQEPFRQFRETTERIADAKAKLPDGQQTSTRIQRLYRKRSRRRDHAVNALLRDLVQRLYDDGVETIYHGDLTGVPVSTGRSRRTSKRVRSGHTGSVSISSRTSAKSAGSTWQQRPKRGPPKRVRVRRARADAPPS